MKEQTFTWTLSHSKQLSGERLDTIPANVPGAVQLDYAQAFSYPPYYFGLNFSVFSNVHFYLNFTQIFGL